MASDVRLDPVDLAILRELQNDARTTNKELAAAVGIAPSTCLDRVARLRSTGVILGTALRVDASALGRPLQALLFIRVQPHRGVLEPFVKHALEQPETRAVFHLTGADDFMVHVAAAGASDLQRLVLDQFTARPEVALVHTTLIFQQWEGGPLLPPTTSS
ncbi:Lrp/AsnC family transcriptional regulator [Kutzneria chonburiensis]|uniref:Lrp/AsnC family transcriptional regulator n=1 Tax=Kutzneria chonburiensis TaxID=1483604 RepID=A0ABV6MVN0_9PSEU|nr:Lrp/AsnC family transcriptional regulator [Kutzneria chonburiensis]